MRSNVTNTGSRSKERKQYFPFDGGMRSQLFTGEGANYQLNLIKEDGFLSKLKQAALTTDTGMDSIEYISQHQKFDGTFQTMVFGVISGDLKLRVIDSDGALLTPGTQVTGGALTGTVATTTDSPTITGSGTAFTTELSANDYIIVNPGDGRVYRILKIVSDTDLTITEGYIGTTISGSSLNIITFPGGIGDATFTGTVTTRQVGGDSIIGSEEGFRKWEGSAITNIYNVRGNISTARDGSRIAYVDEEGIPRFTDASPNRSINDDTGSSAAGNYDSGIRIATAVIEGGVGVVIFGRDAAEAHWVQPNNASDEVTSKTRIDSFSYIGRGVDTERKVVSSGRNILFMNEDGVFKMDSFSGQAVNLIEGGKIERYWKEKIDQTNGFMAYDPKNDIALASVAMDSSQENVFIAFNLREKELDPFIIDDAYWEHAGLVNGQLVGGESRNGKVYDLFTKFETSESSSVKGRFITEFDALGSPQEEKTLYSVTAVLGCTPGSNVRVRAYKDGETTPFMEKVYVTTDLTTESGGAPYGEYSFAIGAPDLVDEIVTRGERKKQNSRFRTLAVEVFEDSSDKFNIYDMIVEYKRTGRLAKSLSIKNNLF